MYRKLVLLFTCMMLGIVTMTAQKRVTGTVVDEGGVPVIGAAVRVQGTKLGVSTDVNGAFVLKDVPATAKTLTVTYIGMETATARISPNVKVVMKQKDTTLDEAVVVGYGTGQKVGTVVGAVKTVKSESISGKPAINVADALQGQVAGTQILNNTGDVADFTDVSIKIRGAGSVSASSSPLVVVDGSPASSAVLGLLNSNDIESISVLKDASATSIYGARAANGVMYITTKKGRRGEKAQIWVSQKFGWTQLANSTGNPMNSNELLNFQLENNIISVAEYQEYKSHGVNTDWQNWFFDKKAPMNTTNFSIRGGSEKTTYFVSGEYNKTDGLTYKNGIKKYNLRTNLESNVNDWFTFGLNQGGTYTERASDGYTSNGSANLYSASTGSYMFAPYWDPYDPSVKETHQILYGPGAYDIHYLVDCQPYSVNDVTYTGQGYAQIQPIRLEHHQLTWKTQLGLFFTETRVKSSLLAGTIMNSGLGEVGQSFGRSSQWTLTNTLEYKLKWNENHLLTVLLGQEGIRGNSNRFSASSSGHTDNRFLTLGDGPTYGAPSESRSEYQYLSFFGRADYALMNRYYFDFTVRNDASSRFGYGHRAATFFSGGAKWNVKNETFMEDLPWLKELNVKVSIGSTGNSEIGNYAHLGLVGNTMYGGNQGWGVAQVANSKLGWEKQVQYNVGFDFNLFNIVRVDFNVYKRKTTDMLLSVPLAYTTGYTSQMQNIGAMSNRGVEVEVNIDAVKKRNGYLGFRFTYGYNQNRIDALFYGYKEWPMKSYLLSYIVGKSLNFYMPIYAGVDKEDGAPMWYKVGYRGGLKHEYNPETMTKNELELDNLYQDTGKNAYAPSTGGFGVTASWKGLSLIADFSFVLGKYMVNNEYFFAASPNNAAGGFNQSKDMLNIWKKPGDIAKLPGFNYTYQFDTHVLQKADFLRLKTLTLCYDLPKQWMEATKFIENVRLNFTGRNLFTVTPYTGADPEIDSNVALGNYPATRQYTIGLEVTF